MIFQWLSFLFIRERPKTEKTPELTDIVLPFKNFKPIFTPIKLEESSTAKTEIQNSQHFGPKFETPQFYRGSQEGFPAFPGCKRPCSGVGECAVDICNGYCCKKDTQACPEAARTLVGKRDDSFFCVFLYLTRISSDYLAIALF